MFASSARVAPRERAAVLALMTRGSAPWTRLAGAIEERGSAIGLLQPQDDTQQDFAIEGEHVNLDEMRQYIDRLNDEGITVVSALDRAYPVNLRLVHDRPPVLFVRGELSRQDERSVAIVGSRKASAVGLERARTVASSLLQHDYVIVSGLAAGIDSAAHRAALEAGARTVGIIGTGLRHAYPKSNASLQAEIASKGAVLSQFWPGQEPHRWTFPQRNAVMSGFARATVVIEASEVSGVRIQVRFAREHGRPVFLFKPVLKNDWARRAAENPGVYIVDDADQIAVHLERLYPAKLKLVS